ncbi:MAG: hypothetical protein ACI8XV_002994, partial [Arenicella sp.]
LALTAKNVTQNIIPLARCALGGSALYASNLPRQHLSKLILKLISKN